MFTMSTKMLLCFVFLYIEHIDTYITAYTHIYYIRECVDVDIVNT